MAEQSESPFFPVPVRWFELPMNTARWGFARLADLTEAKVEVPRSKRVESPAPATFARDPIASASEPETRARVGRVLDERA
jgi:hypothetical protein